VTDWVMRWSSG